MAKSSGRRKAAARLFVCALVGWLLPAAPAVGQRLELRGGVVASSALATDAVASGASTVRAQAKPAPMAGVAALFPLRGPLALEAGAAYAFSGLRAEDGSGSWAVQGLGIGQLLLGVRYRLSRRRSAADALSVGPYLRAAAGGVRYFSPSKSIFANGSSVQPAAEVAAGWARVAGRYGVGAELGAQLHAFAPETLRQAGASAGGVRRGFLVIAISRKVRP